MKPTAKTSVDGERRARVWFVRVKRRKRRRKRRRRRRWWRRRRRKSRRNAAGSALFFCFPRPPSTLRRKSKLQITNNKKKPIKRTHWPDEPVQPDRKTRSHLKKKTKQNKTKKSNGKNSPQSLTYRRPTKETQIEMFPKQQQQQQKMNENHYKKKEGWASKVASPSGKTQNKKKLGKNSVNPSSTRKWMATVWFCL